MPSPQRENESLLLQGDSLGDLCFDWNGDRYLHYWHFSDCACRIESIESDSSELWPTSPPLQQIHQQSFADGREVIFGVGMSGRGHWSASFTLVPELKSWIVELACRSPVEPGELMSSYALHGEWEADGLRCEAPGVEISLEAISPGCRSQIDNCENVSVDRCVRFLPVTIAKEAATSQWAFRLRVQ